MASLQDLQRRRKSVEFSQKLTAAMKMVASAKLTQLKRSWALSKENNAFLRTHLSYVLSEGGDETVFPYLKPVFRSRHQTLVILIGSDRGLCGGFNGQIIKAFQEYEKTLTSTHHKLCLITCGRRMVEFARKSGHTVLEAKEMGGKPTQELALFLLKSARKLFFSGEIDSCVVVYTEFVNPLQQKVMVKPVFPFVIEKKSSLTHQEFLMEPCPSILGERLLDMTLGHFFYLTLVESHMSEQGSRMTAMENATRNSQDILKDLDLLYNRKRQSLITNELLEVIAGASV